jgi:hypothetical protein
LESLLSEDSFPPDYAPLFPDFMFLPVCILKIEVERVGGEPTKLKKLVQKGEDRVLSKDPGELGQVKNELFRLGKTHLKLRDRWLFGKGLAENLAKCISEISRLQRKGDDGSKAIYPKTLTQTVETQIALCNVQQLDPDAIPSRIKQQHRTVPIPYSKTLIGICSLTFLAD